MSNKTYFVVSDIHSFYRPLKEALWKAGFRKTNKNHILCVCGDIFDRGDDTIEVYNYLMSIPKSRRIMIKGNHESLYLELLFKKFPQSHDFHNGTVSTFCQIAGLPGIDAQFLKEQYYFKVGAYFDTEYTSPEGREAWEMVVEEVRKSPITAWLYSKEWVDYYELPHYILVHSFIPTKSYEYDPNWRQASESNWEEARWGCPWKLYLAGLLKPENDNGKTLVCGHWHAWDFSVHLGGAKYATQYDIDYGIYYSKDIVAIDACTAMSDQCNVLVLETV